jgi:hypothetical protein
MRILIGYFAFIFLLSACASDDNAVAPSSSAPVSASTPSTIITQPDVNVLLDAIAKTQSAKAYRLTFNITLSFSEGERKAEQTFLAFTGERASGAYHLWYKQGLFNELPGEGQPVEMILVDGQTYVRGANFFGESKPEQWYWLTRSAIGKPAFDVNDLLNILSVNPTRARALRATTPEPLDGQICPAWTWDAREQAQTLITLVSTSEDKEYFGVIEQVEARITVCPDGFAHELAWQLRARHTQKAESKSRVNVTMRLTDFDAKELVVKPPIGALEWSR